MMKHLVQIFAIVGIILSFAACSKPSEPAEPASTNAEAAAQAVPSEDNRPLGPTPDGYLIVQATDGRKAELKFTDRSPDGTLSASGRNRQSYSFPESRLTAESIAMLHDYMSEHAMISIRLQELTSHTSNAVRESVATATGNTASTSNRENTYYRGAGSSHIVHISTTSPFDNTIVVESFYTSGTGRSEYQNRTETYTISRHTPIKFQIEATSSTVSILHPTVIVRNSEGKILDYETKNPKILNELRSQR
ncbi:hypothetical protein [Cerasicoccus frondis]|uniref:hypothetical protein n=1 Tax=Cerasicoccus frondis TaxID=490090 RepID=UPI0028529C34|nr:hypothetical protein [Cerasicoccus frondis]